MEMNPRVRNIKYYIVKSCAGIEVEEAKVEMAGLAIGNYNDHEFAVVDAQPDRDGAHLFVSQRGRRPKGDKHLPQMALINTVPDGNGMKLTHDSRSIDLPYDRNTGTELTVKVHTDVCHGAIDQGDELAAWFSKIIGFRVRLVKASGNFSRRSRQNYMRNDNALRFQDGYPIHWFPIESVNELSARVRGNDADASTHSDISWQRFRPQIVIEGMPAQYEHKILMGYVGDISFKDPKPCERCSIPLIDQETGQISKREPNYTLAKYKLWRNMYGENAVIFGENMLPLRKGTVRVGDPMRIVGHRYPPLAYGTRAA